ncbi:hypothetical protein Btru_041800 [Bulinus truncatus]|nr:hypothetical protein Btru_041800 [Bulinus truncatus]
MEVSDSGAMKSAAVSLLCPVTVQLLKNPSVQAARALTKALAQVKTSLIQELQSYIIYPVEAGLRSKNVRIFDDQFM